MAYGIKKLNASLLGRISQIFHIDPSFFKMHSNIALSSVYQCYESILSFWQHALLDLVSLTIGKQCKICFLSVKPSPVSNLIPFYSKYLSRDPVLKYFLPVYFLNHVSKPCSTKLLFAIF